MDNNLPEFFGRPVEWDPSKGFDPQQAMFGELPQNIMEPKLHVCGAGCGCEDVQIIDYFEVINSGDKKYMFSSCCPNCGHSQQTVSDHRVFEAYKDQFNAKMHRLRLVSQGIEELNREEEEQKMSKWVDKFVHLLELDEIYPIDF